MAISYRRLLRLGLLLLLRWAEAATTTLTSKHVLQVARLAARDAGTHLAARVGKAAVLATKQDAADLVTAVDGECQDMIEAHVRAAFPTHAMLGEESVPPGVDAAMAALAELQQKAEWIWIVDPIDGTTNFVSGLPLCAVSIGITRRGERMGAAVYDPFRDELFTAWRGEGAWLNEERMSAGPVESLSDAVLCACSPHSARSIGPALRSIAELMPRSRSLRILGSGVLNFAWVACGRLSAYWEPELAPWDCAAGTLLIEEAGGTVSALDGTPYTLLTPAVLGCASGIHAELVEALLRADAAARDADADDM